MALLELHYMTARGAGICRYLRDEETTLKAMKSLAKRHIDATLIDYETREEMGSVEETPEGKWVWWFWAGIFKPAYPGERKDHDSEYHPSTHEKRSV